MKLRIFLFVLALTAALHFHVGATQNACERLSVQQYLNAVQLCRHNAERINCWGYCRHLASPEFDDPEFHVVAEENQEAMKVCYRTLQLPCEVKRDFALNDCLVTADQRHQDHWNSCASDPNSSSDITINRGWPPVPLPR